MATQRALIATKVGSPLTPTTTRAIPQPGPDQVQIKVTVTGLNPHDAKARDWGLFIAERLPAVLTNDVVGKVTALGPGVTKYAVGDRIVSQAYFTGDWDQSGLQEYAVADLIASAKIPDSISDDEAATVPTNLIAPLVALFDVLPIPAPWADGAKTFDYAGTTLLIVGGGSSCGKFGVQLAKLAGIGKIVVVGGDEALLKSFGATHVLNRHGGDEAVLQRIKDVVGDDLIYAYDAINDVKGQVLTLKALSSHKKGILARLLPLGPVDESQVEGKKAGFEVRDVFGSTQQKPHVGGPFWERATEYLETKKITPLNFKVEQGLNADIVNKALDDFAAGKGTKVHIHI